MSDAYTGIHTIAPKGTPTGNYTACDPERWDAVKNAEICTDLSGCSALIDFENIAPNNCGEFCASHGLQCDDANDEKENRCQIMRRTSVQFTCDTPISTSTGWDAICYCSDPPTKPPSTRPTSMPMSGLDSGDLAYVVGGKGSVHGSFTSERGSSGMLVVVVVVVIAAVGIVGVHDVSTHSDPGGCSGMLLHFRERPFVPGLHTSSCKHKQNDFTTHIQTISEMET